mgnify:CR=1 FL=1
MKKQERRQKYDQIREMYEPVVRAKNYAMRQMIETGKRMGKLRYLMLAVLFIFLFTYHFFFAIFTQLKMREKMARAFSMVMVVVLVFTSVDVTVLAAWDAEKEQESEVTSEEIETSEVTELPENSEWMQNPEEMTPEVCKPAVTTEPAGEDISEKLDESETSTTEEIQQEEQNTNVEETEQNAETEQSEETVQTIQVLQERINALPTVDEFIAMADGTTVEGSTLNQAQLNAYNEAQAIAEEIDSLTEEEQEKLDLGKLNALFKYFNNQVQENADYVFDVKNGFAVAGDKSLTATFQVSSNNLDMRGWLLCLMDSQPTCDSNSKLKDSKDVHPFNYANCKYYFFAPNTNKTGTISVTWSSTAIDEKNSGKTLAEVIAEKDWYIVIGPRHYNTGWGDSGIGAGTNGIWENCDYFVGKASTVIPGALHNHSWKYSLNGENSINATCEGTGSCAYIGNTYTCTLNATNNVMYSGNAYTGASETNNITGVTGASASAITYYLSDGSTQTTSSNSGAGSVGGAPVNAGSYQAKISIGGVTATASFTIVKADITPKVSVADWVYGSTASAPQIIGGGDGKITYYYKRQGETDTTYQEIKPDDFGRLQIGKYTLKVEIAAGTNYNSGEATCNFAVTKRPVTVDVTMADWAYGDTAKDPVVTVKVGITDITDTSQITYTYYTDSDCKHKTTLVNGAKADGDVPQNAGTYYVKAFVAETDAYAVGNGVQSFTIERKSITVTVDNVKKHIEMADPVFTYKVAGLISGDELKDITVVRKAGEDAGDFTITATAEENSNPNYDITFISGTLTIEDHVAVKDAVVEATCTKTGLTEGSHCSVCNKVLVVQQAIAELGHDWSEWTVDGNYERSICKRCGQIKYRVIDPSDTGLIEKDVEVAPDAPITEAALGNKKSELIAASGIFAEKEKTDVENGANARVWLEIATADISGADMHKIEEKAKEIVGKDISKVVYFDVNLFKTITKDGSMTKTQITEPGVEIEVTVSIPKNLLQTEKTDVGTYKIIRFHNGVVESLDAKFDRETGTLTFKTDRFSIYAIAYMTMAATPTPTPGDNGTGGNTSGGSDSDDRGKDDTPAATQAPAVTQTPGTTPATASGSNKPQGGKKPGTTGSNNSTGQAEQPEASAQPETTAQPEATTKPGTTEQPGTTSQPESITADVKEKDELHEETKKRLEEAFEKVTKVDSDIQAGPYVQPESSVTGGSMGGNTETGTGTGTATILVEIPEDLRAEGRTFYLMMTDADGNIIILPNESLEDGIISVTGSADAVYQIIYEDGGSTLADMLTEDGKLTDANGKLLTVSTNHCLWHWLILVITLLGLGAIALLGRKKKKYIWFFGAVTTVLDLIVAIIGFCVFDWIFLIVGVLSMLLLAAFLYRGGNDDSRYAAQA